MANNQYVTSSAEKVLNIINLYELEEDAGKVIPQDGYGYIYSGAGDLYTIKENIASFNHKYIVPHVLRDIENPDTKTEIFGDQLTSPIIMAPVAAHKLANTQGEAATAKGIADYGSILTMSSFASASIADMADAAHGGPQWFQLYMSKDDDINRKILDEAMAHHVKAIVLTADATVGGNRETDKRNHFTFPVGLPIVEDYQSGVGQTMDVVYKSAKQSLSPRDVKFISDYTHLPVFVKGVQTAEDVEIALQAGAKGIWVSNHGGRQLDGGPAAFDSLQVVAKAVNKRVPIVFDSGIRRAQHVFKALASGADIVAIGRPVIYGLALGGSQGVKSVFDYLQTELELVMQLAGTHNIDEVKATQLLDNLYGN
ncbi:alpha-hydroxy-acid oxidizing protein [Latilactobacillus fuchuensis]|uniref:L-lactate oxidase n=1 Tax=Latilactobacillus fuchuensis TaxID=164393 RepID=A0A2N9DWP7_9LACO|nr:alpha-hydroxy-acid oxidizing protein [Latilactobacillus fuchuensis]SPC39096.1 L-Lactate oxidase [Latilactobacillus fuchuensis]